MRWKKVISFIVFALLSLSILAVGLLPGGAAIEKNEIISFSGGNGTEDLPYLIEDVSQLQNINFDLAAYYELVDDIDGSGTEFWNDGRGFEPIGSNMSYFKGSFNAYGYSIKDLYINRSNADYVGLFGYNDGTVKNVRIEYANITGNNITGILAGANRKVIENSSSDGSLTGNNMVGGLVGHNYYYSSYVKDSTVSGEVKGNDHVGGLVGWNDRGEIINSSSSAYIEGMERTGGLVGANRGWMSGSNASGNIFGEGRKIGGLIGWNQGSLETSYATGDVSGDWWIGGLVGYNKHIIKDSYATGVIKGNNRVGGLVGINDGTDENGGTIVRSYATGKVLGTDEKTGGLVGGNTGTILFSNATGDVEGFRYTGGLVGWNYLSIENSYASGDVVGKIHVGGLSGHNYYYYSSINNSYATGNVSGDENVSGLVGWNDRGSIDKSYSIGHITGDMTTGGLVGKNKGSVKNSFWDTETSGQKISEGGIGKTTSEMKNVDTFTDLTTYGLEVPWDFVNDPNDDESNDDFWDVDFDESINFGYPFLVLDREVIQQKVEYIKIYPEEEQVLTAGETANFSVEAFDKDDDLVLDDPKKFTWQNAKNGLFFETETGQYDVIAIYNGIASNITTVTVEPGESEYVVITPKTDQVITAGDKIDFDAEAYDHYENLVDGDDTNFTWQNTDTTGLFTEEVAGDYEVNASYDRVSSTITAVTVEPTSVDYIKITPEKNQTLTVGEELAFTSSAYDESNNLITDDVSEFSWVNVEEFDPEKNIAIFSKQKVGDYEVTSSYEEIKSSTITITVSTADHHYIVIEPNEEIVIAGDRVTFQAFSYDRFNNEIGEVTYETEWSIENGAGGEWLKNVYTSKNVGEWNVTGRYNYDGEVMINQAILKVETGFIDYVLITPEEKQTVKAGDHIDFAARAYDHCGNLIISEDTRFKWVNTDDNGVFSKTTVGEYEVRAIHDFISSERTIVTVEPSDVYRVSIEPKYNQTITSGETVYFLAKAYDEFDNLITDDNADFNWINIQGIGFFDVSEPGKYEVRAIYDSLSSNTVTVIVEPEEIGAVFVLSDLRIDLERAIIGEEITIMIDVTNIGDILGEYTVEFYLNGDKIGGNILKVEAGDTQTASMTYVLHEEGHYYIQVGDEMISITSERSEGDTINTGWGWIVATAVLSMTILIVVFKIEYNGGKIFH